MHHLECEMVTYPFCSLAAYSEKPETIDWNFYKRNISLPGFVDSFQKQFEALKIPLPKDTASAAIEEQKKKFVSAVICSNVTSSYSTSGVDRLRVLSREIYIILQ